MRKPHGAQEVEKWRSQNVRRNVHHCDAELLKIVKGSLRICGPETNDPRAATGPKTRTWGPLLPSLRFKPMSHLSVTDRRIGRKAEEAGAVLLALKLLKHNTKHAKRATACLLLIQVFASAGTTSGFIRHPINTHLLTISLPVGKTKSVRVTGSAPRELQ